MKPTACAMMICSLLLAGAASGSESRLPDWAPKPPPRIAEERLRAEVMLFGLNYDTTLRIDPSLDVQGTVVNAEDDLGLDDSDILPLAELTLLPGKHHLVRLSGMTTHRKAQQLLDKDVLFEDDQYFLGERVDSEFDLTLIGFTYGYRFLVRDAYELSATLGVQIAEVSANAVVLSRVVREAESGVAPLPLLGLEGRYDFTPRWSIEARAQYLTVNVSDIEGDLLDVRLAGTWRLNPHFVVGLGYRRYSIKVDSRDEGTPGLFDMTMDGPMLYMRASL